MGTGALIVQGGGISGGGTGGVAMSNSSPPSTSSSVYGIIKLKNKSICDIDKVSNIHLIPQMTQVTTILLQKNKITSLTSSKACAMIKGSPLLYTLTELNLSHNRLKDLPQEMFSLANLERLFLDHNNLSEFSLKFLALSNLQKLTVGYNKITEIPWRIDRLFNLKYLHLEHNNIDSVPNNLGKLQLLELKLYGNPLGGINNNDISIALCTSGGGELSLILKYFLQQPIPEQYKSLQKQTSLQGSLQKLKKPPDVIILKKLLKDPKGYVLFELFLEKELSQENIHFWADIRSFRTLFISQTSTEEILSSALQIFHTYIAEDAPSPVNISGETKDSLNKFFNQINDPNVKSNSNSNINYIISNSNSNYTSSNSNYTSSNSNSNSSNGNGNGNMNIDKDIKINNNDDNNTDIHQNYNNNKNNNINTTTTTTTTSTTTITTTTTTTTTTTITTTDNNSSNNTNNDKKLGLDQYIFNDALNEIENLMSRDSLKRFKATEEGSSYLFYLDQRKDNVGTKIRRKSLQSSKSFRRLRTMKD